MRRRAPHLWLAALCALAGAALPACATPGRPPLAMEVYFDTGRDEPRDAAELATVERVAQTLRSDPALQAVVIGHADARGDPEANRELSLRRARRVRALLIARGVAPGRLRVAPHGENEPSASNETDGGQAANRRAELFLYDARRGDVRAQYGVRLDLHDE